MPNDKEINTTQNTGMDEPVRIAENGGRRNGCGADDQKREVDDRLPSPELVERLRKGDEVALAEFIDLRKARLMAIVRSMGVYPYDAEDVVYEAFMKVWEHRQNVKNPNHLVGYATKTAKTSAYDYLRKRSRSLPRPTLQDLNRESASTLEPDAETGKVDSKVSDDKLKGLVRKYDLEILLRSYGAKARVAVEEAITLDPELVETKEFHCTTVRTRRKRALERYEALFRALGEPVCSLPPILCQELLGWEANEGVEHPPARLLLFHLSSPNEQASLAMFLLGTLGMREGRREILSKAVESLVQLATQSGSKQMERDVNAFLEETGLLSAKRRSASTRTSTAIRASRRRVSRCNAAAFTEERGFERPAREAK